MIACAAAQYTRNCFPDFGFGRARILIEERLGDQNLCRCAVTALDGSGFDKCKLERMQALGLLPALVGMFSQSFNRNDIVTLGLGGQ